MYAWICIYKKSKNRPTDHYYLMLVDLAVNVYCVFVAKGSYIIQ